MPELPDVIPGEFIESDNQNLVQRRTVQRYTDQADLDTKNPTPQLGDLAFTNDWGILQIWDGIAWSVKLGGGGIQSVAINDTALSGPRSLTGQPIVRMTAAGTATEPTYTFHGASDTGVFLNGSSISLTRLGVLALTLGNFFASQQIYDATDGGAANVVVASNGRLQRSTSARKYKSDVSPIGDTLKDVTLEPVTFHHDGDGADYIGFIADDMPDERAITRGADGDVENYDLRAVVAILTAKVNDLTARLDAVEA